MKVYSVTEFREEVNELLEQVTVAISGEIRDFHVAQNRFVWFSLADEKTTISCFMLSFQLKFPLADGMKIKAVGSPTLFKKGQFVFRPRQITLAGEGSLQKAYEILKSKLEKEGLFAAGRKRLLPRFVQNIGLITSKDAAAYTDVLRILKNRWAGLNLVHANVNVQGQQAVNSIVQAVTGLNQQYPQLECIILTRGGGSLEDLAAFNSEEVARAIFSSSIPVVSAIGHERDITIADLVADVRAATPSNAAELVVPHKDDVLVEIQHMTENMEQNLHNRLNEYKNKIGQSLNILEHSVRDHEQRFISLQNSLQRTLDNFLTDISIKKQRLISFVKLLNSLHPQRVLERGYCMALNNSGKLLKTAKQATQQKHLIIKFVDDKLMINVKNS